MDRVTHVTRAQKKATQAWRRYLWELGREGRRVRAQIDWSMQCAAMLSVTPRVSTVPVSTG